MTFRAACALFWRKLSITSRSVRIATLVHNRSFWRKPPEAQNLSAIMVHSGGFLTESHRHSRIFLTILGDYRRQEPRNRQGYHFLPESQE